MNKKKLTQNWYFKVAEVTVDHEKLSMQVKEDSAQKSNAQTLS